MSEQIKALIDELGLAIESTFIPFSKSRSATPDKNGKVWRSLNWTVTLTIKGHKVLTTDYSQGEAHCPAYKASIKALGERNSMLRDEAIAWECEHGVPGRHHDGYSTRQIGAQPLAPDVIQVLHCLLSDADALDHGNFEDWASNLGYDADSRKHEAIYRQCLELALKLRNGLGEANLARLREAFQDY